MVMKIKWAVKIKGTCFSFPKEKASRGGDISETKWRLKRWQSHKNQEPPKQHNMCKVPDTSTRFEGPKGGHQGWRRGCRRVRGHEVGKAAGTHHVRPKTSCISCWLQWESTGGLKQRSQWPDLERPLLWRRQTRGAQEWKWKIWSLWNSHILLVGGQYGTTALSSSVTYTSCDNNSKPFTQQKRTRMCTKTHVQE